MISDPFATVLSAGRSQFNKKVIEARRRFPTFDAAAFAEFMQTGVDPMVRAVAAIDAARVPQVVMAAYDAAVELCAQSLAGAAARTGGVNQVWAEVAPHYAHLIAQAPAQVLALLTNGVIHLEKHASVRPGQWVAELAAAAPQVQSLSQLQSLGQVLAWRAGLVHFRSGALAAAGRLPDAWMAHLFGVDLPAWPAAREAMLADPWWGAAADSSIEVGAFTGFGGEFARPPQVRACDDGFLVRSGERYFLLMADVYGAILHAASEEEFVAAAHGRWPAPAPLPIVRDLPASTLTVICNAHTMAVSSPYTHAIRLLPLP